MISAIKEIINKSNIIMISENVYFCIWNKWTVKIYLIENQQEYLLHYNGVYVTNYFTYENSKNIKINNYLTLGLYIKEEEN